MITCVKRREDLTDGVLGVVQKGNVYYSEAYEKIQNEYGSKALFFFDEDFVLVVYVRKRWIFRYGDLPTEPISINGKSLTESTDFLNEVLYVLEKKCHLHWVGPVQNQTRFLSHPNKCKVIPFGNYIVDLKFTKEELWQKIHSKHRNVIRKAEKDGLELRIGVSKELFDTYLKLDKITWERSGKRSDTCRAVGKMLKNAPQNTIIYIAEKEGEAQGGAVFFYNECMAYYLYGASIDKPSLGAMNWLHWNAMLDFKEKGVELYSFVGCRINEDVDSKYHTIQRFKKRFGGELEKNYMFKCILNRFMYQLFCTCYSVKHNHSVKKVPMDIIDEEYEKWG